MCGGRVVSSSSTPIMIDRGRSQYDHAAFVFNGEPSFRGTLNCRLYFPPSDLSREQLLVAAEGVDRNGGIVFFPQKDSAQAFALRLERSFNVDQYLASGEGAIACRLIGVEDTTKRDFGPCYKQIRIGAGVIAEVLIYSGGVDPEIIESAIKKNLKGDE
jgi:hypothetical protein